MPKEPTQEVLPPLRNVQVAPAEPVRALAPVEIRSVYAGDPIDAFFDRWWWNSATRAVDALTRLNVAEVACVNAQTALVEADTRQREVRGLAAELPERVDHQLTKNRMAREGEIQQLRHELGMAAVQRRQEIAQSEIGLIEIKTLCTRALTVLVDAEQQLEAQRQFGGFNYELAHKKKQYELLDVELSAAERRALLRQKTTGDHTFGEVCSWVERGYRRRRRRVV
jgi:hypothetical protein